MVEISVDEAGKLMEMYRKDWPKSINGYHALDTFIQGRNQGANIKVFSLNGKWEEDGTFIITVCLGHLIDDSLIVYQIPERPIPRLSELSARHLRKSQNRS